MKIANHTVRPEHRRRVNAGETGNSFRHSSLRLCFDRLSTNGENRRSFFVPLCGLDKAMEIPAKRLPRTQYGVSTRYGAGIQGAEGKMDSRFRGNDEREAGRHFHSLAWPEQVHSDYYEEVAHTPSFRLAPESIFPSDHWTPRFPNRAYAGVTITKPAANFIPLWAAYSHGDSCHFQVFIPGGSLSS